MWRVADVWQPAWCSALPRLYLQHQKPCRWGVENSLVIVRSIDQWSHQDGPQETLSVLSLNTFWINKRPIFWTEKTSHPKNPVARRQAAELDPWMLFSEEEGVTLIMAKEMESSMDMSFMSFMSFISNQKTHWSLMWSGFEGDHSWVLRLWFP